MNKYHHDAIAMIRAAYSNMSNVEHTIADYFLHQYPSDDLSQKSIAERIFVSEASLSRFAQRCGFSGFREFIYCYRENNAQNDEKPLFAAPVEGVLTEYQALFSRSIRLIDEPQFIRIVQMMQSSKRVHIYGYGQSGYTAYAIKARFMRLGLVAEVFTEDFAIMIDATLEQPETLFIGISVSGKTKCVLNGLKKARSSGAKTILITAFPNRKLQKGNDELLRIAAHDDFSKDAETFPQYPLMLMVDLLFAFYLYTNLDKNSGIYNSTHQALNHNYIKP